MVCWRLLGGRGRLWRYLPRNAHCMGHRSAESPTPVNAPIARTRPTSAPACPAAAAAAATSVDGR